MVVGQPILSCKQRVCERRALCIRDTALDVLCSFGCLHALFGGLATNHHYRDLSAGTLACDVVPCTRSDVVPGLVSGSCQVGIQSVTQLAGPGMRALAQHCFTVSCAARLCRCVCSAVL